MGSDDFILDPPGVSNDGIDNNGLHDANSELIETDFQLSAAEDKDGIPNEEKLEQPEVKDEISNSENMEQSKVGCGGEDHQHLQTMDLDRNLVPDQTILQGSVELAAVVTLVDEMIEVKSGSGSENGGAVNLNNNTISSNNIDEVDEMIEVKSGPGSENGGAVNLNDITVSNNKIDVHHKSRVKRARITCVDEQPSVRVFYNSLTRESKRKLEELLQQWSQWHTQNTSSSNEPSKEGLETGEETFFPALHVGMEKSSTVSFWMDFQARPDHKDGDSVPLYDRGYASGLTSLEGSANLDRGSETFEASRCFNCGSYNHSLKECPKPRDNVAVNNARKQHNSKRNPTAGPRLPTRYYQNSPGGKFDGLKPGVLGAETRQCLGIGEFDPPPWLNRMRELGYPPGYLDSEAQDKPSEITIFADEETEESKEEHEDGEILEAGGPEPPEKKMTVEFPGINAPIPDNADERRWAASPGPSSLDSYRNRSRPSEGSRGHYRDQRRSRDYREPGPPGVDPRADHSMPSYTQRYGGYDSNYPRSPSLGRSLSDRGWWGHSRHDYNQSSFEDSAKESQHQRKDWNEDRHHHRK